MAEKLDPKGTVRIEEVVISQMFEIAALVELLERRGVLARQEVLDTIQRLRQETSGAEPTLEALPEPYCPTEAENAIIGRVFELLNATGLTAHQAKELLHRVVRLVDLGDRLAKKTTH